MSGMVLVIAALASGPRLSDQLPRRPRRMLRLARLGAARRVCLQVLLRDVGQFAVGAQFVQGLVQVRQQPAVLPGGEALLALLACRCRDLHRGVAGLGKVGVHRDAVVDHQIDPALVEQLDGLGEALDGLDARTVIAGDLRPVAGGRLAGDFALNVVERLDGVVVGPGDDDAFADRVRLGEVVLLFAFGVDGHLVGDHVEPVGLERGEDRIPRGLDEFDFHPEFVGDGASNVDVIADELAGRRVVIAERGIHAFGADSQHARCLDRLPPLVTDEPHAASTSVASSSTARMALRR